jgi:hypothetical protein
MIGGLTPEEQEIFQSVAGAATPLDLRVHLTNKHNLDLMRQHYEGLKVTIEDAMSDSRSTAFSFESKPRHKSMMIQLPSDIQLDHSDLDKFHPVNDFYAAHKRELANG